MEDMGPKLSLNVDKTICMLFGTGTMLSKCDILNVTISGKRIDQRNTVKYLGIYLDSKLKWNIHIDEMCTKISKVVSFLARLRHFISESNLKIVYNSIILPLFDYADIVYDSASKKYTDRLQKIQNRAGHLIKIFSPIARKYQNSQTQE